MITVIPLIIHNQFKNTNINLDLYINHVYKVIFNIDNVSIFKVNKIKLDRVYITLIDKLGKGEEVMYYNNNTITDSSIVAVYKVGIVEQEIAFC